MACPARYFDGSSAVPHPGVLSVSGGGLLFTPEGRMAAWISPADLDTPQALGGEIRLPRKETDPSFPAGYWMIDADAFNAHLRAELEQLRPGFLRRMPLAGWLALCLVALPLLFLATMRAFEAGHALVPISSEKALGDRVYELIAARYPPCDNAAWSNALNRIAAELSDPHSPIRPRVAILNNPEPNAFALPGGRIVFFTGLLNLAQDPGAIAGVMAHELAHAERRHALRQMMRTAGLMQFSSAVIGGSFEGFEFLEQAAEMSSLAVLLKYSREMEREADRIAVEKLHARRRSVAGVETLFKNLDALLAPFGKAKEILSWMSTHPGIDDRLAFLAEQRKKETFAVQPWPDYGVNWSSIPCAGAANGPGK